MPGAAILGRQTYLIIVPVLVVLIFRRREKWPSELICIITSLAVRSCICALAWPCSDYITTRGTESHRGGALGTWCSR